MTRLLLPSVVIVSCAGNASNDSDSASKDRTIDAGAIVLDASILPGSGGASDADSATDGPDARSPACTSADCDPSTEMSGCTDGLSCVLDERGGSCIESAEERLEAGMDCTSTADCAPTLGCFLIQGLGVCAPLCCPSFEGKSSCTGDQFCLRNAALADGFDTSWGRCAPSRACDVLAPSEVCDAGEGCFIVSGDGDSECLSAGNADVGEGCVHQNDCRSGLSCVGVDEFVCVRICDLDAEQGQSHSCPAGEGQCVAYSQSPVGTGLCTPSA
ncbi:MAG: hypothetical protein AAF355_01530 [Myxococcota bacterium]